MKESERHAGESGVSREEQWHIHQLIARCRKGLQNVMDRELRPLGIDAVQMGILDALVAAKGSGRSSTPTELGVRIVRRHNSVVSSLMVMERAGLVCLTRKPPGRRTMEVELTPKGEQVYHQAVKATRRAADILGKLSQNQRQQLTALLEKLDQALVETLHGIP
jgi:DNA-binding MarR family transcriptional regulator